MFVVTLLLKNFFGTVKLVAEQWKTILPGLIAAKICLHTIAPTTLFKKIYFFAKLKLKLCLEQFDDKKMPSNKHKYIENMFLVSQKGF